MLPLPNKRRQLTSQFLRSIFAVIGLHAVSNRPMYDKAKQKENKEVTFFTSYCHTVRIVLCLMTYRNEN